MQTLLLSIVTVVRNAQDVVASTLESVASLRDHDVELIVVDGASTDRTLEVVGRFRESIDVLISEPDTGIYDAMNKGIARARGRFVLHVNAGDRLLRIPRSELMGAGAEVLAVSLPVQVSDGRLFRPRRGWRLRVVNTLHHQGTFYRVDGVPPYDTRYRTFADFDRNQKLAGRIAAHPDALPVSFHTTDGVSHQRARFREFYDVVRRNQGLGWLVASWCYLKLRGLRWRLTQRSAA